MTPMTSDAAVRKAEQDILDYRVRFDDTPEHNYILHAIEEFAAVKAMSAPTGSQP